MKFHLSQLNPFRAIFTRNFSQFKSLFTLRFFGSDGVVQVLPPDSLINVTEYFLVTGSEGFV